MIRRCSSEGGEEGAGEHFIPSHVDENSVQSFQSRRATFVGPSVASVKKRNFNEAELVYAVIEGLSLSKSEVRIVLFMSVSYHIKVATQQPGGVVGRAYRFQLIQEIKPKFRGCRSIDIRDEHGDFRVRRGEVHRKCVGSGTRPNASEEGVRPG
jgi:hypothetical protein